MTFQISLERIRVPIFIFIGRSWVRLHLRSRDFEVCTFFPCLEGFPPGSAASSCRDRIRFAQTSDFKVAVGVIMKVNGCLSVYVAL